MTLEEISARLYFKEDRVEIDFCPINVSKNGFSVFTSTYLAHDTEVILALENQDVVLRVKWCRTNPEDQSNFRCGLETVEQEIELDKLILAELDIHG